jgi:hypothetical protein
MLHTRCHHSRVQEVECCNVGIGRANTSEVDTTVSHKYFVQAPGGGSVQGYAMEGRNSMLPINALDESGEGGCKKLRACVSTLVFRAVNHRSQGTSGIRQML